MSASYDIVDCFKSVPCHVCGERNVRREMRLRLEHGACGRYLTCAKCAAEMEEAWRTAGHVRSEGLVV